MNAKLVRHAVLSLCAVWMAGSGQESAPRPEKADAQASRQGVPEGAEIAKENLRLQVDYFEMSLNAEAGDAGTVERLKEQATSYETFRDAVMALGTADAAYRIDHGFFPGNVVSVTSGANVPVPQASRRSRDGEMQTTVNYQDVGLKLEAHTPPFASEPDEWVIRYQLECSSVGTSDVQVSAEVRAPVFRNFKHGGSVSFRVGVPQVLLLADGVASGDKPAVYRIIRMAVQKG